MERFFNTAGPVKFDIHYCLPPLERFDLNEIIALMDQQKYFVLHAPRQVGKTSYLLALMNYLNQTEKYHCLYFNVEVGQFARDNVEQGIQAISGEMASRARTMLKDPFPQTIWQDILRDYGAGTALNQSFTAPSAKRLTRDWPRPGNIWTAVAQM